MSEACADLHDFARDLARHRFPFEKRQIPGSGIYLLFERGETGHGGERIVRVGTHTGADNLFSRLYEHFLTENKDRSIFRKHIGRALLTRDANPFLSSWNIDLTKRENRERYGPSVDLNYQSVIEAAVSEYVRDNFSFVAFDASIKEERLSLESKLISTLSLCDECHASASWLGHHSPHPKIRESGLWLVNHLYKIPATIEDIGVLRRLKGGECRH